MAKKSKKYVEALSKVDRTRMYDAKEALTLVSEIANAKFDETVEAHIKLGVDSRHADQQVRGAVVLPHGTGKTKRVLVFAKGAKAEEATNAGADFVGAEDLVQKIQGENWFEFDVVVATPDMMGVVGRLGRVLGPKGLMPNPKTGTVTMDVTKAVADVKSGDKIVVGLDGVRVTPPHRSRSEQQVFEFMNSEVSSEKPLMNLINGIAEEMKEIKAKGGKIGIVGGPAIVHTGSGKYLASLIREGYIDVIMAGNALATHDIECDQFGTSLGVNVKTGEVVAHGHTHHMRAINRINKSGSIREAVEDGTLKSGIMYECIKNDVPFVLAGSIRDDGPLPDVITDTVESQTLMRKYTQEIDMVIMIATMLHSIATGNLLPSRVKTICVDINPSTVTKLADRGTAQALGIVTDVGAFLPVLYNALHEDD